MSRKKGSYHLIRTDPNSGVEEKFDLKEYDGADKNFSKIWIKEFIKATENVANKKTKILYHLIKNMKIDNTVSTTIQAVSEDLNISYKVVHVTFKSLMESNFMRKKGPETYTINPNIIFRGRGKRRQIVSSKYRELGYPKDRKQKTEKDEFTDIGWGELYE